MIYHIQSIYCISDILFAFNFTPQLESSISQNQIAKMGHFKIFEHKKAGHFEILARDQFFNWFQF